MTLITQDVPNLINGVSQQPQTLRLASQADIMENGYPSVVEGLRKRFPTEYMVQLIAGQLGDAKIHSYERDRTEAYHVFIQNGDLRVFDIDGLERMVAFPNGKDYLNITGSTNFSFSATTVADFTFIANKEVICAMDPTLTDVISRAALVSVKIGAYSSDYQILIDNTVWASHTTPDSATIGNELLIQTNEIANNLILKFLTTNAAAGNPFVIGISESTLLIFHKDALDFNITVTDSLAGTSLKVAKDSIQKFTDLPTVATDGFTIKVKGDGGITGDDYYVKFEGRSVPEVQFGDGVWEETVGGNITFKFDRSTMPHTLVRQSDGTFIFGEWDRWVDREAGDEDSVPNPSFIGKTIADVFFFKNRLGLLSDDNVILSRAGEFGTFFKATATALLDSDVIDVAASHRKVSLLKSAVPTKKQLILFSEKTQFILDGGDLLTPSTASIDPITEYDVDTNVLPVGTGKVIFFAVEKGSFTAIREYKVSDDENVSATDAQDITAHVPKYIPSGAFHMAATTTDDLMVILSTEEKNAMWTYKYFWSGDDKLQSAWSKWTFPTGVEILSASFIAGDLFLLAQYPEGVQLLRIFTDPDRVDPEGDWLTHLDRRVTENGMGIGYSALNDETTFVFPYDLLPETIVVARATSSDPETNVPGEIFAEKSRTSDSIIVAGDVSTRPVFGGDNYTFRYRFSQLQIRQRQQNGSSVPVLTGRVQVKNMHFAVDRTGYFKVEITPEFRTTTVHPFEGQILGSGHTKVDEAGLITGEFRVPVMSRNDRVIIDLVNDTHMPCQFQSARYTAEHTVRERKV